MIDAVFDFCVLALVYAAEWLGMTYKAINVWFFVVIWPIFTLALIVVAVRQRLATTKQLFEKGPKPRPCCFSQNEEH